VHAAIGFSSGYLDRLRAQSIRNLLLPFALLSLLLAVASWVAARTGLAPLRRLAQQIDRRSPGDLTPVASPAPYVEVEPIMRALNAQLEATARLLDTERRFFAEAAHELRTPLAVLSAQAHVVANESDAARRREALAALEQGIERAARVVSRLLTLARLDASAPSERLEPIDVGELTEEIVEGLMPRAAQSGHELALTEAGPIILPASEAALQAAVENLVDNALRYTPPGTAIRVATRREGDACVVEVADDGPGIDAEHHGRVFGRFERLGRRGEDGTGLGLAIVRRVAEIHGGTAGFQPGAGGRGCRFQIRLPLQALPATA
jgi:signal transduction histidine kinase